MLKMSSSFISALVDTSDRGLSHTLKGPGVLANVLTGIINAFVKCLFIFNWS
jgi:hypothetical protein